AKNVGYIMGPGDEVPQALRQMGCEVTLLTRADVEHGDLSRYEAIVTGVRAFETRPELFSSASRLADYATNGGTLIIQQNQVGGMGIEVALGPYTFRVNRDRVTVEDAPVTFPNPQLRILHAPNEITQADFEGWVQERGVYFADQWSDKFVPVLES